MTSHNLIDLLETRANAHGDTVALRQKRFGIWHEKTWTDVRDICRTIGAGLTASGLNPGARIAILADPSQEAVFMVLAAHYAGAVPVVIYPTLPADETRRLFAASNCGFAYCDTIDRADKILPDPGEVADDQRSAPAKIIVLDSRDAEDRADVGVIGFDTLLSQGETREGNHEKSAIDPGETAVVTLSSGTTGAPKPIELSHQSLIHSSTAFAEHFALSPTDRSLAILPFGHPTELSLSVVLPIMTGMQPSFSESARTMQDDMIEIAPTIVVGPPRLWQKLRGDLLLAAHKTGFVRRQLFTKAMGSLTDPTAETHGNPPGVAASLLVTKALRARIGLGASRVTLSTGGAPVEAVRRFFTRMGVTVENAYSVSEAGGIVAMLSASDRAKGDVLHPLPGFELNVANDESLEVVAGDARIVTDDLAAQADGNVFLRGRAGAKETSGNIQSIEGVLKSDPLIREVVVLSDGSN
ncbi:MAG: AMP-binding protein, partial [Pseudomonadota bacterium]